MNGYTNKIRYLIVLYDDTNLVHSCILFLEFVGGGWRGRKREGVREGREGRRERGKGRKEEGRDREEGLAVDG